MYPQKPTSARFSLRELQPSFGGLTVNVTVQVSKGVSETKRQLVEEKCFYHVVSQGTTG